MSNKTFFIVIAVIVIGVLGGAVYYANLDKSNNDKKKTEITTVTNTDHIEGPENAKVTLIEYGDFQCQFCALLHPTLEEVLPEYKDSVRFVFRHYPIISSHPNALVAHRAAEAAGEQGKFFEMYDLLYQGLQDWSTDKTPIEIFKKYAKKIGLDSDKFMKDFDSEKVADAIRADKEGGTEGGVTSTPTLFLNGKQIENPRSSDDLRKQLDSAIKSAN